MPKKLSKAERQRKVAQQCLWCVIDPETGQILWAYRNRRDARTRLKIMPHGYVIERVDLRIKGVRA
jgi:hypothetical protein